MTTCPDFDGVLALLAAVVRQWADEARRNPDELHALADWLGMDPAAVRRQLSAAPPPQPRRRRWAKRPH